MINVSIVLYKNSFSEVSQLVNILRKSDLISNIYILDNSPFSLENSSSLNCNYEHFPENPGYGSAHNIALRKSIEQNVQYHLVVNPDIVFEPEILRNIVDYMDKNAEIGHLMPKVFYPDGNNQYLCKLIPTPFDLLFRRFLPKSWSNKRMEYFEMRKTGYNKIMDVPYLSGCFMFLRVDALKTVGLFDERFFMYPEDIDLTRRIHAKYRTVFYPEVSIIHRHAQSSYKSFRMMWIHTTNLIRYFNKWGWVFDSERKRVNKKIIEINNL